MNQTIQFNVANGTALTDDREAIQSDSLIFTGVLQTPKYGAFVQVPEDIRESATDLVDGLGSVRVSSLDAIDG
jgi:hypothetical protein